MKPIFSACLNQENAFKKTDGTPQKSFLSHTAWNHSSISPFSQTVDQLAARLEMWNCIKCLSWSSLAVSTERWSWWWLSHPPLLCCTDLPPVLHLPWEPSVSWLSFLSLETPCMQKDSFYLRIRVSPLALSRFNMLSWCLPWERSQQPRNVETGPTARRWPHLFIFFSRGCNTGWGTAL